jgi:hypothetical protein
MSHLTQRDFHRLSATLHDQRHEGFWVLPRIPIEESSQPMSEGLLTSRPARRGRDSS